MIFLLQQSFRKSIFHDWMGCISDHRPLYLFNSSFLHAMDVFKGYIFDDFLLIPITNLHQLEWALKEQGHHLLNCFIRNIEVTLYAMSCYFSDLIVPMWNAHLAFKIAPEGVIIPYWEGLKFHWHFVAMDRLHQDFALNFSKFIFYSARWITGLQNFTTEAGKQIMFSWLLFFYVETMRV